MCTLGTRTGVRVCVYRAHTHTQQKVLFRHFREDTRDGSAKTDRSVAGALDPLVRSSSLTALEKKRTPLEQTFPAILSSQLSQ